MVSSLATHQWNERDTQHITKVGCVHAGTATIPGWEWDKGLGFTMHWRHKRQHCVTDPGHAALNLRWARGLSEALGGGTPDPVLLLSKHRENWYVSRQNVRGQKSRTFVCGTFGSCCVDPSVIVVPELRVQHTKQTLISKDHRYFGKTQKHFFHFKLQHLSRQFFSWKQMVIKEFRHYLNLSVCCPKNDVTAVPLATKIFAWDFLTFTWQIHKFQPNQHTRAITSFS